MKIETWVHPLAKKQWLQVKWFPSNEWCRVKRFWKWGRKRAETDKYLSSRFNLVNDGWIKK